jgi:hypothetical protein
MLQALESTADHVDGLVKGIDEFRTMGGAGVPGAPPIRSRAFLRIVYRTACPSFVV